MKQQQAAKDEQRTGVRKPVHGESLQKASAQETTAPLVTLQNSVGNTAVQRLLAQRSSHAPTDLDDDTADRINAARGGGQTLDNAVQAQMGEAMGADFSGVRVHTGSESHGLNQQLGAKAFTTGRDIFFREGEYNPHSGSGRELLAHELTHVVQQSSGAVPGNGKMAVNAPGDRFEQEADSVAKAVTGADATPAVQRQEAPEEEELQAKRVQRQEMPEEEEALQTKLVQRQEEEELAQMQELPEEEAVQAQDDLEEEPEAV